MIPLTHVAPTTESPMLNTESLTLLHSLRLDEAHRAAALAKKRDDFEATLTAEREAFSHAREAREVLEEKIREAALAAYAQTGKRKPLPGVEIKAFLVPHYERTEALAWAKAHDLALTLDAKMFERIVTTQGASVECVQLVSEPRAQIARDLGPLLPAAAVPSGD